MSKSRTKPVLGITLGDPAGIGPEITAKALARLPRNIADFIVIGDTAFIKNLPRHCRLEDLRNPVKKIKPGKPTQESAQAALSYLDHGIKLLKSRAIDGLVTAPLSKENIGKTGIRFEGHTEYLAKAFKTRKFGMMFVGPRIRTIIVTRHIPVAQVPQILTTESILDTIMLSQKTLKQLFKIKFPILAVCGLNPHAGEGGTIGKEEITKIVPAVRKAQRQGALVLGPFAADTLFAMERYQKFDCIVAMYHDQGLIPVKTLFFQELVNLTIGLPFVRTSPAHGTAFDIAGKNKANHHSMAQAITLAALLSHDR